MCLYEIFGHIGQPEPFERGIEAHRDVVEHQFALDAHLSSPYWASKCYVRQTVRPVVPGHVATPHRAGRGLGELDENQRPLKDLGNGRVELGAFQDTG